MDVDVKIKANTDKGTFTLNFVIWEEDILSMLNKRPDTEIDKIECMQNSFVLSYMDDLEWQVIHERCFDRLPVEYKLIDWDYSFEAFEYD